MDKFSSLLQLINPDNTMSVNRYLAHSIGMAETIIYSALISKYTYYRENNKTFDGWFYSTIEDLQESTTYGRKIQSSAIKKLSELGLIETKLMGMPARRYFRLISDTSNLEELLEKGQEICCSLRQKDSTEEAETSQNSSLSDGANKFVPNGQTRSSQTDKQDRPERTNKIVPNGQTYINLKGNNLKGSQSIYPTAEKKNFSEIVKVIGYENKYDYKNENDFSYLNESERQMRGCSLPYFAFSEDDMRLALRFLSAYSFYSDETSKEFSEFFSATIDTLSQTACSERIAINNGYIQGIKVIDRINELIKKAELSDCLIKFHDKWKQIRSETPKIKNLCAYMKTTLINWLWEYSLDDFY